jgi:CHASE3 domain sensor protein
LPLDEIQHGEVAQLTVLTNKQLDELASLLDIRRRQGRDAARQHAETGADKVGLDTLRSFTDRTIEDLAETMVRLERRSRDYQVIATYCVLFGAFWLYVIILLAAPHSQGEGSLPWYGSGERLKRSQKK